VGWKIEGFEGSFSSPIGGFTTVGGFEEGGGWVGTVVHPPKIRRMIPQIIPVNFKVILIDMFLIPMGN